MPDDLTSRPIVNNNNSVTCKLSKLLDNILKPYLKIVPSYIRDTYDFLSKLPKGKLNFEVKLTSWDIVSLYTNIPNEYGLEAINYYLHMSLHTDRFSKNFILNGLKIILNYNTFTWNNRYFKQLQGVAMGTKVAPTYAILTIGYLEKSFYEICYTKLGPTISDYIKLNFFRFIDDCFLLWNNEFGNIEEITTILNSINNNIKYTSSHSDTKLSFLDVLVYIKNNKLETTIYKKPTESNSILSFNSNHPRHTLRNIPYVLFRRLKTIISESVMLNKERELLERKLKSAHYPEKLVKDAMNKTFDNNFNCKKKEEKSIYPLIFEYNTKAKTIHSQLLNNVHTLNFFPYSKHILNNKKACISYRCSNTLFRTLQKYNPAIRKCLESRCKTCDIIQTGHTINLPNRPIIYPNININCKSSNVIYCLKCNKCDFIYIGQTTLQLRKRITLHRQHTKTLTYTILSCNIHLHKCNNGFKVFPLFCLQNSTPSKLNFIELFFIKYLKPELNCT